MKIKKLFEMINKIISKKEKKKVIENAVIVIIIGIIIIIAGSSFWGEGDKKDTKIKIDENNATEVASKAVSSKEDLNVEKKIEEILSQIEGAGQVKVMITYASGKELVHAYDVKNNENSTDEKDSGGGTRKIIEKEYSSSIVYEEDENKTKQAIVVKEIFPEVKGVVIVADGASDPVIRESLFKAVQALLDVPAHKIQVFERRK